MAKRIVMKFIRRNRNSNGQEVMVGQVVVKDGGAYAALESAARRNRCWVDDTSCRLSRPWVVRSKGGIWFPNARTEVTMDKILEDAGIEY